MVFAWEERNFDHIAKHGVAPGEAEYVVEHASKLFPREIGDGKWVVWGRTEAGALLQVVFSYRSAEQADFESLTLEDLIDVSEGEAGEVIYVVHAMPLTAKQV